MYKGRSTPFFRWAQEGRRGRKPPQGAALIGMREHRALIGQTAYVHPVTYAIAAL